MNKKILTPAQKFAKVKRLQRRKSLDFLEQFRKTGEDLNGYVSILRRSNSLRKVLSTPPGIDMYFGEAKTPNK